MSKVDTKQIRKAGIWAAGLLLLLSLTACNKRCVCTAFNGLEHEYTSEEVKDHGGGCSNMIFQGDIRYYSVCVWR